jgi:hypothetical protein
MDQLHTPAVNGTTGSVLLSAAKRLSTLNSKVRDVQGCGSGLSKPGLSVSRLLAIVLFIVLTYRIIRRIGIAKAIPAIIGGNIGSDK